MGCFEAADGISGITIKEGDKCGLVLLTPTSSYPHKTGDGGTTILEPCTSLPGGGPDETFAAYCLPIWGDYNDYGSIENIEKDATVLGLEKYFETSIDNIIEIVGSGRGIFDSSSGVHLAYGTGLCIDYSKAPNEEWMLEAGFRKITKDDKKLHAHIKKINAANKGEKDNKGNDKTIDTNEVWILPGTKVAQRWDGEAWKDVDVPICWFQLTQETIFSKPETICRTHYTRSSGHLEDHKWEHTYDRSQKDFAGTVMTYTKYGFFGTGEGIQLGVKKEFWGRVLELMSLSGMFLDGKLFQAVTERTDEKRMKRRDNMLDNTYPSKHMMPLLGFKYEMMVSNEDKKEIADDGLPLPNRAQKPNNLVYTHELAPDYYFLIDDCDDNMNVDLFDKKFKDLKNLECMMGEKYSVSTFSPLGIQRMLKILSGTEIEIDHLLELPENFFFYAKMKDYMARRKNDHAEIIKWEEETEYIKDLSNDEKSKLYNGRSEKEKAHFNKMIRRSVRKDSIDRDSTHLIEYSIGFYAKFEHGFRIYGDEMVKQSDWFINATNRWKKFRYMMYATNKIFMPAAHHWQHGEYDGQIKLANTIMKVAVEKLNDRDDWEDEDPRKEEHIPIPIQNDVEGLNIYMKDGILRIEQQTVKV